MLRNALWALRQPRYAALAALMVVIAALCIAAGTWQVSRYEQKVHDNSALRRNAHAATVPLTSSLLPLVGHGSSPGRDAIRYRTVTARGSYLPGTEFVRNQSLDGADGFWALSPFRTPDGVLLVVRGFVPQTAGGSVPSDIPAPPGGSVRIRARLQTADTGSDHAGALPGRQLDTVNPRQQAGRRGLPVYDGYATLAAGQPGGAGVQALPAPDLSNPAGGAAEWQHLAYIVQWYIFALLALAAPFAMSRHEVLEARRQYLGIDPGAAEIDAELPARAGELVVRQQAGGLAVRGGPTRQQVERAARLADRYGRSLGAGQVAAPPITPPADRPRRREPVGHDFQPVTSRDTPYRSPDGYHGSYNDYLWQLALADGNIPDVTLPDGKPAPAAETPERPEQPRIIDGEPRPEG